MRFVYNRIFSFLFYSLSDPFSPLAASAGVLNEQNRLKRKPSVAFLLSVDSKNKKCKKGRIHAVKIDTSESCESSESSDTSEEENKKIGKELINDLLENGEITRKKNYFSSESESIEEHKAMKSKYDELLAIMNSMLNRVIHTKKKKILKIKKPGKYYTDSDESVEPIKDEDYPDEDDDDTDLYGKKTTSNAVVPTTKASKTTTTQKPPEKKKYKNKIWRPSKKIFKKKTKPSIPVYDDDSLFVEPIGEPEPDCSNSESDSSSDTSVCTAESRWYNGLIYIQKQLKKILGLDCSCKQLSGMKKKFDTENQRGNKEKDFSSSAAECDDEKDSVNDETEKVKLPVDNYKQTDKNKYSDVNDAYANENTAQEDYGDENPARTEQKQPIPSKLNKRDKFNKSITKKIEPSIKVVDKLSKPHLTKTLSPDYFTDEELQYFRYQPRKSSDTGRPTNDQPIRNRRKRNDGVVKHKQIHFHKRSTEQWINSPSEIRSAKNNNNNTTAEVDDDPEEIPIDLEKMDDNENEQNYQRKLRQIFDMMNNSNNSETQNENADKNTKFARKPIFHPSEGHILTSENNYGLELKKFVEEIIQESGIPLKTRTAVDNGDPNEDDKPAGGTKAVDDTDNQNTAKKPNNIPRKNNKQSQVQDKMQIGFELVDERTLVLSRHGLKIPLRLVKDKQGKIHLVLDRKYMCRCCRRRREKVVQKCD